MSLTSRSFTLVAALAVALAGCGSSPSAPAADPAIAGLTFAGGAGPLPVSLTDSRGVPVTVTSTARIVPVNGDLTETVFALGLGPSVVARDLSATYPPEVERLPVIGYQRTLNPEPVAAQEPTLVLANTLAGPPGSIDQVRAVAPTVVLDYPDTVAAPPQKIRAVARVLGVPERGEELAARVEAQITAATAKAAAATTRPRVVVLYLRGEGVQLVLHRGVGQLVVAAGGIDVSAELGITDSAPVDAETLIKAAPDVIVATTTGLQSVRGIDGLLTLNGGAFARTPAGRDRRVLAFEDQYLLGLGPRTGDLLTELTTALHEEPAP